MALFVIVSLHLGHALPWDHSRDVSAHGRGGGMTMKVGFSQRF